jgi:hypothetical protein
MLLAAVRVLETGINWDQLGSTGINWDAARGHCPDSLSNPRRQHPPRAGKQPQRGLPGVDAAVRSGRLERSAKREA